MTDCTIWTGGKSMGYGILNRRRANPIRAHQWAYETFVGPIPDGYSVHHRCQNKLCINPDHLEVLSKAEHARIHRPTTCRRGHALTAENYYARPDGNGGWCKECRRLRDNARYRRLHPR